MIIKNTPHYRIKLEKKQCKTPSDLFNIEFVQETIQDEKIIATSIYNLFLTQNEINLLIEGIK